MKVPLVLMNYAHVAMKFEANVVATLAPYPAWRRPSLAFLVPPAAGRGLWMALETSSILGTCPAQPLRPAAARELATGVQTLFYRLKGLPRC